MRRLRQNARMTACRTLVLPLALLLGGALALPAQAEVWGYVDADGTAHVATEQVDARYQLFFKGRTSADAPPPAPAAEATNLDVFRGTAIYRRMVDHPNIKRYQALIERNARARGVDTALVKAVIAVESAFDPAAISAKGALGLMQVIPDTGARYGVAADRKRTVLQKLLDPEINVRVGTTYLADLLVLFADDVDLALAAYNAGEQAVARYANRIPPFPETREYVKLVQQFYELYRPPPAPARPAKPARIMVPSARQAPL
jgi:soluble lytic murein transglycosylase-like protein